MPTGGFRRNPLALRHQAAAGFGETRLHLLRLLLAAGFEFPGLGRRGGDAHDFEGLLPAPVRAGRLEPHELQGGCEIEPRELVAPAARSPGTNGACSGSERPGSEIWMESVPSLRTSTSATPHLSMRRRMTSIAWSTACLIWLTMVS